jgi:hypothetical protein
MESSRGYRTYYQHASTLPARFPALDIEILPVVESLVLDEHNPNYSCDDELLPIRIYIKNFHHIVIET